MNNRLIPALGKYRVYIFGLCILAIIGVCAIPQFTTHAASSGQLDQQRCAAQPSQAHCDGLRSNDPPFSVCPNHDGDKVIDSQAIYDTNNNVVATLGLSWSPGCQSNWAWLDVYDASTVQPLHVELYRCPFELKDCRANTQSVDSIAGPSRLLSSAQQLVIQTTMFYASDMLAQAYGCVEVFGNGAEIPPQDQCVQTKAI